MLTSHPFLKDKLNYSFDGRMVSIMRKLNSCIIIIILIVISCSCANVNAPVDKETQTPKIDEPVSIPIDKSNYNISVLDIDGNDITDRVIELWWCANEIYNVDSDEVLELGEYYPEFDRSADFYEVLNFNEVVERIFSPDGKKQLLSTELGGIKFIQERDGKIYRLGPWKTGWSCGNSILEANETEKTEDRIVLSIKYDAAYRWEDGDPHDYKYVDFVIAKIDDEWYVDDYVYPEAANNGLSAAPASLPENYLSEIHEWENMGFDEVFEQNYICIANPDDIVLRNYKIDFSGLEMGALYLLNEEAVTIRKLYPAPVYDFWLVNKTIVFSIGDKLLSYDMVNQDINFVLKSPDSSNPIRMLVANDKLIFYLIGDTLYRYYIPAQINEQVAVLEGVSRFEPISNNEIFWEVPNPEYDKNDLEGIRYFCYITNLITDETIELKSTL